MDSLYINGNFITMDMQNKKAEAVAIKGNKFEMVGSNEEILALKEENTSVIDLKGKTVTPGFNESHIHLLNYGYSLSKIDLSDCTSIHEIIEKSKAYIEKNNPEKGQWVQGRGWNQVILKENREITKFDLDKITTDYPLSFSRICEHVVVANSKAIELAGISRDTPQPDGGHFDINENGELTGIFRETARYMIYDIIPEGDSNDIKKMMQRALSIAVSYGITSLQSDDFEAMPGKDYEKVITAYKELARDKKILARVYQQCLLPEVHRLKEFLSKGYKTGVGDEFYKIGPLKLLTDGSLGARTAFLKEPYSDDATTCGIPVFTQDELDDLVITAAKGGMKALTHAIGDGAIDMCFKSFEKAVALTSDPDPRFGILHLQITDRTLLQKFKDQNVVAYMEPICLNNDLHMADDRVGEERANTSYNYRTLVDSGVHTCISSDCPVDSINPMKSLYVSVTHKDYGGFPEEGWHPEQCLTVEQALYAFTMGSAYASFDENIKGSIEKGKLADFAVLSDDLYAIDPSEIQNVQVEMTVIDGEVVYQKN